jgi:radical SAM protein with 4Fe4S-binding SPASM domain
VLEMIYYIHPDIGLRNDIDRNIIYVKNPIDSIFPDFVQRLDTPSAILLAFFDGQTTLTNIFEKWSQLIFGKPPDSQVHEKIKIIMLSNLTDDIKIKDIFLKRSSATEAVSTMPDIRKLIVDRSKINLKDPRLRIPLRMIFIPTLKCSQRCYYCYSTQSFESEIKPLPFRRLTQLFKEAKKLGIDVVELSGGEPFCYKNIFKLFEILKELNITPNLPSKRPLTREEIKKLKELGIRSFQISIDAITPNVLKYVVGVRNYTKRIIDTFRYLEEMDIKVRINTVITPINYDDILNLIQFLTSYSNVYRIAFSPYSKSRFHHKDSYYVAPEAYSELIKKVKKILNSFPNVKFFPGEILPDYAKIPQKIKEKEWANRAFCTGGRQGFVLLPDGKVTMCEELYYHPDYIMGDLSKQSIMEMWQSKEALAISYPQQDEVLDGPCRSCDEFEQCHIFPGRCVREVIKTYGEKGHHLPDPRCPRAPVKPYIAS